MEEDCPVGQHNCIFHEENDDEDYCFSPRMRFGTHAKCIQKYNEEEVDEEEFDEEDVELDYLCEIRDRYMPAFTIEQTKLYVAWNPPSAYICCDGCKMECRRYYDTREEWCDCCSDNCKCCAGCCFH